MEVRIQCDNRCPFFDGVRQYLLVCCLRHPDFANMGTRKAELTQSGRGISRNALVQDQVHQIGLGSCCVRIRGAVLKVSGSEGQSLLKVIRFEFGIVPKEIVTVRISCHCLDYHGVRSNASHECTAARSFAQDST